MYRKLQMAVQMCIMVEASHHWLVEECNELLMIVMN